VTVTSQIEIITSVGIP